MKHLAIIFVLATMLTGCHTPKGQAWERSEVYFGLSRPDGSLISDTEWQKFLDEAVTPKFPSGLSVVNVAGQWRNATGHIDHEQSRVLVLLHKRDAAMEKQIDEIRTAYCQRFHQEAVMKVTSKAHVAF